MTDAGAGARSVWRALFLADRRRVSALSVVANVHRALVLVVAVLVIVLARADSAVATIAAAAVVPARFAIVVTVAARVLRRRSKVLTGTLLVGAALARSKDAEQAGVARLVLGKRGELALSVLAAIARAFVFVVAILVVIELGALSRNALERARFAKRPVAVAILGARFGVAAAGAVGQRDFGETKQ